MKDIPKLILAVPCYNEAPCIQKTSAVLRKEVSEMVELKMIQPDSCILFIDDGSNDGTWELVSKEAKENGSIIKGIKLAHNRGHQKALLTGLLYCVDKCDCCISLDADLQDDIAAIREMVNLYINDDDDVVYGVRSSRETDTGFKKFTAESFYKLMKVCGVDTVFNHADYRLMSNHALKELAKYKEANVYLRGIVPDLGLPSAEVYYDRKERTAGKSHYPLTKMLTLAIDGITSFTVKPLTAIAVLGAGLFGLGVLLFFVYLILGLGGFNIGNGWLYTWMFILSGINVGCLGIVGIYVGRAYMETKQRPISSISDKIE